MVGLKLIHVSKLAFRIQGLIDFNQIYVLGNEQISPQFKIQICTSTIEQFSDDSVGSYNKR